jgi:curved DNA-binding protein CbpA
VLESHPDKNPKRREWSERRVRELIQAYEVLGNAQAREAFDRSRKENSFLRKSAMKKREEPFFFRKTDPESKALLVLHFLLNRRPRNAVNVLSEMEARCGEGFLHNNLEREDYLDCLFLLSEFHMARRDYGKAAERLRAFYLHERGARFPRHYTDEVIRLLKDLYLRKLPRFQGPEAALEGLREAKRLGLTRSEEFLRLKKTVEMLLLLGKTSEARRVAAHAARLYPLSKEIGKIRASIDGLRIEKEKKLPRDNGEEV